MRIYDGRTPQGRKVERPESSYCPECEGRDGRHCLVSVVTYRVKSNGRRQKVRGVAECPNDQGEHGVDDD